MRSSRFSTRDSPLIVGHRGASGHALENSLEAFRLAASDGDSAACDAVEFDIHTTQDGAFVVHHDPVLSTGEPIASVPARTVCASRLADGSEIPTLEQVLGVVGGLEVFVEAKGVPRSAGRSLISQLRAWGGPAHVHWFDHRVVARLRHLDASIPLGVLSQSYPVEPVRQVLDAGATTLWQEARLIDEALIRTCHQSGIAVMAWTVNDPSEARRLIALGVDGLCGDYPERLKS